MVKKKIVNPLDAPPPETRRVIHVRVGGGFVSELQSVVRKIGTAIIGGDFSGNKRGDNAVDVQIQRGGLAYNVASGLRAIAIGRHLKSSGTDSIALGSSGTAQSTNSVSVGNACDAVGANSAALGVSAQSIGESCVGMGVSAVSGDDDAFSGSGYESDNCVAIGTFAQAQGDKSNAIGYFATNLRVSKVSVFSGAQMIPRPYTSYGGGVSYDDVIMGAGVECVIFTPNIDLKTVADRSVSLPTGCRFHVNTCGLVCPLSSNMTVQPTVRFGDGSNFAKFVSARQTVNLTATGTREIYASEDTKAGNTSLSAGVTVGATATTHYGRFYWHGILIQNYA